MIVTVSPRKTQWKLQHKMLQTLLQKLLLHCDPETAHTIAKKIIPYRYFVSQQQQKPFHCFGLMFPNRVGLAAGWDKDAECFDALLRMGFGFVEVGTITPKPQSGNPKPRLFRIKEKQALINRMGFNNAGIDAAVEKLQTRKATGILGVNIGKNKETQNKNALDDYAICLQAVYPYADYIVVNISSPNTPGLRELQDEYYLRDLLQGISNAKKTAAAKYDKIVPILVKTSVDLPLNDYESFVQTVLEAEMDGLVISNATLDHSSVPNCHEAGGLSGAPLRLRTTQMIAAMHQICEGKLPIVGVGGILSGVDAMAHLQAGAQLVQVFTGFVYRGTQLIKEILQSIDKID